MEREWPDANTEMQTGDPVRLDYCKDQRVMDYM